MPVFPMGQNIRAGHRLSQQVLHEAVASRANHSRIPGIRLREALSEVARASIVGQGGATKHLMDDPHLRLLHMQGMLR